MTNDRAREWLAKKGVTSWADGVAQMTAAAQIDGRGRGDAGLDWGLPCMGCVRPRASVDDAAGETLTQGATRYWRRPEGYPAYFFLQSALIYALIGQQACLAAVVPRWPEGTYRALTHLRHCGSKQYNPIRVILQPSA